MIQSDWHYDFPIGVYLLLVLLPILGGLWFLFHYRKRTLRLFADPNLLDHMIPRSSLFFWSKVIAIGFLWVFATLAVMQPKGNAHYPAGVDVSQKEEFPRPEAHDIFLLVDASASMNALDRRTQKSQFHQAKEIADTIISQLHGNNISLYAFTSDITQLSPLTMDTLFVRLMLKQMQINEGEIAGTDLFEVLSDLKETLFSFTRKKTVVILTDGQDTILEGLKESDKQERINAILARISNLTSLQLQFTTIGVGPDTEEEIPGVSFQGQPVHVSLNYHLLQHIAKKGKGNYYSANTMTARDIADRIALDIRQRRELSRQSSTPAIFSLEKPEFLYDFYYQIPLGIATFFMTVLLFLPDAKKRMS